METLLACMMKSDLLFSLKLPLAVPWASFIVWTGSDGFDNPAGCLDCQATEKVTNTEFVSQRLQDKVYA